MEQGYAEIDGWLGLKRVKTIWEWLRNDELASFVRETNHEIGEWKKSPRRFKVYLGEPMTEEDRTQANEWLARRGFGAVDTHNGAIGTPTGGVDIHRVGAVDTLDWREWHSLNTLALGLNHAKNTPTTTVAETESDLEATSGRQDNGVVGMEWNLSDLLLRNRISAKNQELLLKNGLTAQAFVSWLLYAASTSGNGIRDPIAHAVSRLIPDPSRGAGGAFDQLSELPASELAEMLVREINGQSPWNQTWRKTMEGALRSRLRTLADQLGLSVPDTGYW